MENKQCKTGKIVILGRARLGKSFLVSILSKNRSKYIEAFCSNGGDKTACPVHNIFTRRDMIDSKEFKECFEFHSDFNSIYASDADSSDLRKEISSVINKQYYFDSDDVKVKIKEIEKIVRKVREKEEKSNRKESNTYISVYLNPSDRLDNVMKDLSLSKLEVIDTPGVSGNVVATKLSKADLYIIMLRPDSTEEAQTLKKIVPELKPHTASSKVIFMFKKESFIDTNEEYDQYRSETKESMAEFENLFSELKGSIIDTDSEILNISKNTVMFPTMKKSKVSLSEELFLKEFYARIKPAFDQYEAELQETNKFKSIVNEHKSNAVNYILELMQNISKHEFENSKKTYTLEDFKREKHDRVMTNDNYRIRNSLNYAYEREVKLLYAYFSKFKPDEVTEEWKQNIIRYIYRIISKSVRQDRGIGIGKHPFEEFPARTMLVEESICADTVYIHVSRDKSEEAYTKALIASGVESKTWNYVGVNTGKESTEKLEIVRDMLLNVKVSTLCELILYRYIGGLRKIAELDILRKAGLDEKRCKYELSKLPF